MSGDNPANLARAIVGGAQAKVWEVCRLLDEEYGSGQDPIYLRGDETTPTELGYSQLGGANARRVRVSYYSVGRGGNIFLTKNGTLLGMLRDRMLPRSQPRTLKRHARTCPTCGQRR